MGGILCMGFYASLAEAKQLVIEANLGQMGFQTNGRKSQECSRIFTSLYSGNQHHFLG